jgi:hypothetical protein
VTTDFTFGLENRPGTGAQVLDALGRAGVNVEGACATTEGGSATVHLAVEDAASARQALSGAGVTVDAEREVLLTTVQDRPGEGAKLLRRIADAGVNVEFLYLATNNRIVFGVDDIQRARGAL